MTSITVVPRPAAETHVTREPFPEVSTTSPPGPAASSAVLSVDGRYRYWLTRAWAPGPRVVYVAHNPSTADAHQDDASTRRMIGFARAAGCGSLTLVNRYPNELPRITVGTSQPFRAVWSDARVMSDDWSQLARARRIDGLQVQAVGRLQRCSGPPGFVLRDPGDVEIEIVTLWLLELLANDCSSHTVRAYGLSLLRFLRFLWAVDVVVDRASSVEARDFVLWARRASKFVGSRREPGVQRLPVSRMTGKRYQTDRYSASTINHTLTAVHEFYQFCIEQGVGPVLNPVPVKGAVDRHRDPEREFDYRSRGAFRQRQPSRSPRALPDQAFDAVFSRLSNNRDRALVAFYISSGARASEVLGLTGEMINYGDQLIGVVRKGGLLQWLPVAPDALIWLRLYQLERGTAAAGQPVWLTLKDPRRAVTYDALRVAFTRVNRALGSNWTLHDLRHTFAIRALNAGIALHELQLLLGHASINTTSVYTVPRAEDVIAHYRAVLGKQQPSESPARINYDPDDLTTVLGGRT